MSEFHERLKELILNKSKGKNKAFSELTTVPQSTITEYLKEDGKRPGMEFFVKLVRAIPNLNLNWLIEGEGEMYHITSSEENKALLNLVKSMEDRYEKIIEEKIQLKARLEKYEKGESNPS